MGETRVDLVHLLQDLREAYPGSIEETIVTEMVANALDSGASVIEIFTDSTEPSLTLVDNGVGGHGAPYLAYRKAIQETVVNQLSAWGMARELSQRDRPRSARPMERDLERVLIDLADDFPLLSTLVERRSGGQRRLPIGVADESGRTNLQVSAPEAVGEEAPEPPTEQPETPPTPEPEQRETTPPATSMLEPGVKGRRRPTQYRLSIQFEHRPDTNELSRLVQSTVWINEAHPA